MASAPLAAFLRTRKGLIAHGASHWVVGNEAGDLDSLASAIGYAFFAQYAEPSGPQWIPVVQTPRRDLALRPENLLMLHKCRVDPDELTCVDDVPKLDEHAIVTLVDHNTATNAFADARVETIVDHHADDGRHTDAPQRVIVPPDQAGSCASVLTASFAPSLPTSPALPAPLVDLLLGAVLLDTHNFSASAAKAHKVDEAARAFLAPRSSYPTPEAQQALYDELVPAKSDISALSLEQKLRRDYKQFACAAKNAGTWRVGTSSTVEPLTTLVRDGRAALLHELGAFCDARQLDVEVVLAGYADDAQQPHREVLVYARDAESRFAPTLAALGAHGVDLAPLALEGLDGRVDGVFCAAYTQRDARVTRKQFAPALQAVCAQLDK